MGATWNNTLSVLSNANVDLTFQHDRLTKTVLLATLIFPAYARQQDSFEL